MPGVIRRVMVGALGAGLLAAVPLKAAQAYWYPYPYYGYGYGYVPRPVYVAPPIYTAPPTYYPPYYSPPEYGRMEPRRARRVPIRTMTRVPTRLAPASTRAMPSPFAGPGLEGIMPASASPSRPTLVPAPATPAPPQPAGSAPVPGATPAPQRNAYPPESFTPFRGD